MDGGAGSTSEGVTCLDNWLRTQDQQVVKWDVIQFVRAPPPLAPPQNHHHPPLKKLPCAELRFARHVPVRQAAVEPLPGRVPAAAAQHHAAPSRDGLEAAIRADHAGAPTAWCADRCADWSDHAGAQFMPLRTGNHTNVEDMNAAARKIMSAHRIPIVDLCEGPSLPVPCNRARSRAPPHLHLAVQTAR